MEWQIFIISSSRVLIWEPIICSKAGFAESVLRKFASSSLRDFILDFTSMKPLSCSSYIDFCSVSSTNCSPILAVTSSSCCFLSVITENSVDKRIISSLLSRGSSKERTLCLPPRRLYACALPPS